MFEIPDVLLQQVLLVSTAARVVNYVQVLNYVQAQTNEIHVNHDLPIPIDEMYEKHVTHVNYDQDKNLSYGNYENYGNCENYELQKPLE
nr:hypothetical protein [Sporanaerobacter sp. PP17-6a]